VANGVGVGGGRRTGLGDGEAVGDAVGDADAIVATALGVGVDVELT
jgi:predicted methyltransferase MtxX (methanogen marker protein 4)